jgi:hypothetical protein
LLLGWTFFSGALHAKCFFTDTMKFYINFQLALGGFFSGEQDFSLLPTRGSVGGQVKVGCTSEISKCLNETLSNLFCSVIHE